MSNFCCKITGGSSGIGKCVAFEALKRGAALVTIVARNEVSDRKPQVTNMLVRML